MILGFIGFVIAAKRNPDELSLVTACDDLANFASHRDFLLGRNERRTSAATRGALPAHCVDGRTIIDELIREKWLIGRESTPKDKGRLP